MIPLEGQIYLDHGHDVCPKARVRAEHCNGSAAHRVQDDVGRCRRFALCWVLMPDHWHGLVQLGQRDSLPIVVNRFKVLVAEARFLKASGADLARRITTNGAGR